jgi:hypothetical protein
MEHTASQRTVREKAREALRARTLPTRAADRMWGGRGEGARCSICHLSVKADELEFELEYLMADGIATHHVHVHCFTAWECERDNVLAHDSLQQSA